MIATAATNTAFRGVGVVPELPLRLLIDRQTGGMTLLGATGGATGVFGYQITSDLGALDNSGWRSIAGHYDQGGNKEVDVDDNWNVLSANDQHVELSEAMVHAGNGGSLAVDQNVNLGNSAWIRNIQEDVQMKVLLGERHDQRTVAVAFVGGAGEPFGRSDLDFDTGLDRDDWLVFQAWQGHEPCRFVAGAGLSKGDLNYDGFQNGADLSLFMADYDAANGAGAFDMLVNPTAGDYNDDGIVDAADYTVWRDNLGAAHRS